MAKERLDVLLVERGLAASRERAKRLIMAGAVLADGRRVDKAGAQVPREAELRILGEELPYVSRGGLKLAKAIQSFGIGLAGKTAADIGASTGGFTDCMLQHGARKVYAIDVGYGQLAWKLRTDERVTVMERTNIRYVEPGQLGEPVDFASADVAFISLAKVLPAVRALLAPDGEIVTLVKPQFEAGRSHVGKKGVVRDPAVHLEVVQRIVSLGQGLSLIPCGLDFSPVKGPEGNIEYLAYFRTDAAGKPAVTSEDCARVVRAAHRALD